MTNSEAAATPFLMSHYVQPAMVKAKELERQAEVAFVAAQSANRLSDAYAQAAVIFATAMFFSGICQIFDVRYVRAIILSVALLFLSAGIVRIFTLPIQTLGWVSP